MSMKNEVLQTAISEHLAEIMRLAYLKTQTTMSDVFVTYMAHVNELDVKIYDKGWKNTPENAEGIRVPDYHTALYLSGSLAPENVTAELQKIITKLENL